MVLLTATFVIVTLSLFIQFLVLFLVAYGYVSYRRFNLPKHGRVMAWAVFVQVVAVFAIMVPSFVAAVFPDYIVVKPFELTSVVSLFHEVTGGLALALGVWFVAAWRFRPNFAGCFGRRRLMLATMVVWLIALLFGITLYSIFNWAVLMG